MNLFPLTRILSWLQVTWFSFYHQELILCKNMDDNIKTIVHTTSHFHPPPSIPVTLRLAPCMWLWHYVQWHNSCWKRTCFYKAKSQPNFSRVSTNNKQHNPLSTPPPSNLPSSTLSHLQWNHNRGIMTTLRQNRHHDSLGKENR